MDSKIEDRLANAREQGQAQFDSIKEMVEALTGGWETAARAEGWSVSHDGKRFVDRHGNYCDDPVEPSPEDACGWESLCQAGGIEPDREDARQRIEEDPLSIEVRSGWYVPGSSEADTKPVEYNILLCTGGPACRIIGQLSQHGEPETARLEVQDWFTPWTAIRPIVSKGTAGLSGRSDDYDSEPILLAYARCFWFGD